MPRRSRLVPSSPTIIGCWVGGTGGDGDRVAGTRPSPDGRVTTNSSASSAMIAAAAAKAPSLRLRAARRCLAPCRSKAPGSGRTFSIAERSTSRASGIPRFLYCSQRLPAFGRKSSHGRGPNTQDLRRLLRWVSEQINEHESGALALSEPEEKPPHIGTHVCIEERITALRDGGGLPERHRHATTTCPEPVERDPEQVRGGVVDPVDRIPSLPELQERILHQLLRVAAVPGHQVEGLEEALVFPLEQRAEAVRRLDPLRGGPHDLTFRPHGTSTHEHAVVLTGGVVVGPPGAISRGERCPNPRDTGNPRTRWVVH